MSLSDPKSLERELLLIQCRKADIEGRDRVATATKALAVLESNPNSTAELFLAAALANYNAGVDTRQQEHFDRSAELGLEIVERFDDPVVQAEGHHYVGLSLPRSRMTEARGHWEQALHLLEAAEKTTAALHLKAKIANALAEHLSYGSDLERSMAKRLFETSIELKQRPDIDDASGLAMSHGGLGRLALITAPADYVSARHHFSENLRLSEELGSLIGQTKMLSLLGAVDIGERKVVDAKHRYETALRLAAEQVDRMYALSGLVESCALLGQLDLADQHGSELVTLVVKRITAMEPADQETDPAAAIPVSLRPRLINCLHAAAALEQSPWHNTLSSLIDKNKLPPTTMR